MYTQQIRAMESSTFLFAILPKTGHKVVWFNAFHKSLLTFTADDQTVPHAIDFFLYVNVAKM